VQVALVDTGPLVAILDRSDAHHQVCREALKQLPAPLLTVWPVLTEAMHLLAFSWEAQRGLWGLLESGGIALLTLTPDDAPRMRRLMEKYRDLPMDFADAALVRVAERERISSVLTTDQVDFFRYRPDGIGAFEILPEPARSSKVRRRRRGRARKRLG
jgi:predicted nucleic acid-binding protein